MLRIPRRSLAPQDGHKARPGRDYRDERPTEIVLVSHRGDVVALGASRIRDVIQGSARWTTFADPEGNEFDLIAG